MASFSNVSKEVFTNLAQQLVCHKCQRSPILGEPRWYRCQKLHQICQNCKEVNRELKCLCTQPILKDFCSMTEALLTMKSMQFKCKNDIHGCQAVLETEAMTQHEPECIYRLVTCPKTSCKFKVPLESLFEHMESNNHCFSYAITRDLKLECFNTKKAGKS